MDYDVLVLGGGIIGCAVAYELSRYNLNIALIEKDYDIADDVALVNTAIVYDGSECKDRLMSKLEVMGNSMFDEITSKFNVPFKRTGSLLIAEEEQGVKIIQDMYDKSRQRGIDNIYLIDGTDAYEIEPNLTTQVKKALYSRNTGVVSPYDLAIGYGEVAFDNGVNFRLEEEVLDIQKISKGLKVTTNKNKFTCKVVVNTTPAEHYTIDNARTHEKEEQKQLNYLLLDNKYKNYFTNIIFSVNSDNEMLYSIPTLNDSLISAISTDEVLDFDAKLNKISGLVNGIRKENINGAFDSVLHNQTIIVDDSDINKGYIKVMGKHYGQVTITPSIAKIICETIVSNLNCKLKKNFIDRRREFYRFKELSKSERNEIIRLDKRYGKMVCLCNMVTEGEIVDSIRRPLGARTIEGIKRRTGVTFGSCQGAYCISKIISILARETDKKLLDIVKDSKSSKMLSSRIKEFDEM